MISLLTHGLVLGLLTAILPTKQYGGQYEAGLVQAIKVAVSAWLIIFAAITVQTLRTIASYKVERGTRLMGRGWRGGDLIADVDCIFQREIIFSGLMV
jgi:hypothetical protein